MTSGTLTQTELLALALEATRRGDSGHAMEYLKQAAARADATPEACFLLGSEYAQIGLAEDAFAHLHRAVALAPHYSIARFQLGLLHLTNAQPDEALAVWAPLADLGLEHPLAALRQGLEHLIRDQFVDCIRWLERGIELNIEMPALNADMQKIIEQINAFPPESGGVTVAKTDADEEPAASHLFLNAYTGGKVH
jgi:tetratricopeptide (TPR) repeat protein